MAGKCFFLSFFITRRQLLAAAFPPLDSLLQLHLMSMMGYTVTLGFSQNARKRIKCKWAHQHVARHIQRSLCVQIGLNKVSVELKKKRFLLFWDLFCVMRLDIIILNRYKTTQLVRFSIILLQMEFYCGSLTWLQCRQRGLISRLLTMCECRAVFLCVLRLPAYKSRVWVA